MWGALLALTLVTTSVSAESMDFALERLAVNAATCRTADGFSTGVPGDNGAETCIPDNDAFINLINTYGMAIAPTAMYPAHTTGFGGFEIALEGTYTSIHSDADYLKKGTRGPTDSAGVAADENSDVPSMLQMYSLRIRKGFGFGVETGLQFGFMPSTSLVSGGIDLRLAILEGFRDGPLGYLPDFAVTGSARTITGTSQVQLTVAGVSGTFSKPITIAQSGVLTPWFGYQHLFLFGDSGVIDFTPADNALQACGYQGPNTPGTPGSEAPYDGRPLCSAGGSEQDFNNGRVFDPVRLQRQRLIFGANYRYEMLTVGGQLMISPFDVGKLNKDEAGALEGEPKNTAFSLQIGVIF